MSAGDPWANDAEPKNGWGCWPRLALLTAALIVLVALAACRPTPNTPSTPPAPTTGVQPQPPVTTAVTP